MSPSSSSKSGGLTTPGPCPEALPDARDLIRTREHDGRVIGEPRLGALRNAEFLNSTVKHHQVQEDDAGDRVSMT